MKKLIFAVMMAMAAGVASAVSFSYQGALRTAEGGPIPADESNKTITFRLYGTPAGEGALWGRTLAVHLNDNGLFNVELSDTAGSDVAGVKTNDLAWVLSQYSGNGQELYIGLDIAGSSGEIRPRQKLLNVPTAAFAADVSQARRDFTVEGIATIRGEVKAQNNLTVTGALTAESGLTVSSGNLTITRGTLAVPNGGIIPRGGIIMWSGSVAEIPAGWALCNGGNGTPDLRGRFIVGASKNAGEYGSGADQAYTVGNTGGRSFHKLNADELPKHTHEVVANRHYVISLKSGDYNGAFSTATPDEPLLSHSNTKWAWQNATSEKAHENRPPYYALCFIMKL